MYCCVQASSPELIKWVDGHKQLFKVVMKFDTTIYALVSTKNVGVHA